ncbi:DUF2809 domain-containing protein [Streptomyces sp. NPDC099050]|uniref:ribosomal maturation YjgA family protein n=1 Tax=Streptomyces sp. NPDC099050 TaxID=3366100 RepID=UPI00380F9B2E
MTTSVPASRRSRAVSGRARTRLTAVGAVVVTLCAGLGLRIVATGSLAKYGGDALYTLLVFALVVAAVPRVAARRAAAGALAVSWAVEFLQLTGVPAELSRHSVFARLVLGSTFNPPDLFWYAVGAAAGWLGHVAAGRLWARPGRRSGVGRV